MGIGNNFVPTTYLSSVWERNSDNENSDAQTQNNAEQNEPHSSSSSAQKSSVASSSKVLAPNLDAGNSSKDDLSQSSPEEAVTLSSASSQQSQDKPQDADNSNKDDLSQSSLEEVGTLPSATSQKLQNEPLSIDDIIRMIVNCTSCGATIAHRKLGTVFTHPVLNVIICHMCWDYYNSGEFSQDENGVDEFCGWCAEGGILNCCDHCSRAFCKKCIRKNLGRSELLYLNSITSWKCYVCDPSKLTDLVSQCRLIYSYNHSLTAKGSKKPRKVRSSAANKSKFPLIDSLFGTLFEESDNFNRSVKHLEKKYKKNKSSGVNCCESYDHIMSLLKIHRQNIKSIIKHFKSVDIDEIRRQKEQELSGVESEFILSEVQQILDDVVDEAVKILESDNCRVGEPSAADTTDEYPDSGDNCGSVVADISTTAYASSETDHESPSLISDVTVHQLLASPQDNHPADDKKADLPNGTMSEQERNGLNSADDKSDGDIQDSPDLLKDQNLKSKMNLMQETSEEEDLNNDSSSSEDLDELFKVESKLNKSDEEPETDEDLPDLPDVDRKLSMKSVVVLQKLNPGKMKDSDVKIKKCSSKDAGKMDDDDHFDQHIDNLLNVSLAKQDKSTKGTKKLTIAKDTKTKKNSDKDEPPSSDSSSSDDSSVLGGSDKEPYLLKFQREMKERLLADSSSSASSDAEEKEESQNQKATKNEETTKNGSSDAKNKNEAPALKCKLLRMKLPSLLDDDSSKDSASNVVAHRSGKKMKGKNRIARLFDDSDDSIIEDFSSKKKKNISDSDGDTKSGDGYLSNLENNQKNESGNKRKVGSSSESDSSDSRLKRLKKRRRIKVVSESSGDEVTILENSQSPNKAGRKNIRKLLSSDSLTESTRKANKAEKDRQDRVTERQNLYNEVTETHDSEVVTKKLVLESDPITKEELVVMDKDLICRLKPHQVEAVKFMWECTIESLERSKAPGSGCILAHCMGLGKSLSVIAFIHTIMKNKILDFSTCLILCPLNTVLNWRNEITKWLDEENLYLNMFEMSAEKLVKKRAVTLDNWQRKGGICIMGYEMFRNLVTDNRKVKASLKNEIRANLLDPGPDVVICDEGHVLRNSKTGISKAVKEIRSKRRIILTGTPLQNNLKEYHCMVNFVKENLLGNFNEFSNRFLNPIMNGQCSDSNSRDVKMMKKRVHILFDLLKGCVQSRDYTCLTRHLTPKYEYIISVRLTDVQHKLYEYYLENKGVMRQNSTGTLFADYNVFQRISNHPWLLVLNERRREMRAIFQDDEENSSSGALTDSSSSSSGSSTTPQDSDNSKEEEEQADKSNLNKSKWWTQFLCNSDELNMKISGKINLLFSILSTCELIGDKVLLFSQSILTLDLIESCLHKLHQDNMENNPGNQLQYCTWRRGHDYFRMDGTTNVEKRTMCTTKFNDPDNPRVRLFLISTKAGSLGINLVAANRVIIFDASWNPSHDIQAIFRAYRFGQVKPVYIYRFLAQGTMEEKIYDRQVMKQSVSLRVVEEKHMGRHFSNADLANLYSFDPESKSKHATPLVPKDKLLAELLINEKNVIVSYHEHDSLLEHTAEENLTELERVAAWAEYEAEKKGLWDAVTGRLGPGQQQFDIGSLIQTLMVKFPEINQDQINVKLEESLILIRKKQQEIMDNARRQQAEEQLQRAQNAMLQNTQFKDYNLAMSKKIGNLYALNMLKQNQNYMHQSSTSNVVQRFNDPSTLSRLLQANQSKFESAASPNMAYNPRSYPYNYPLNQPGTSKIQQIPSPIISSSSNLSKEHPVVDIEDANDKDE